MKPLSRGEKFTIGASVLGLGLTIPVWHEALKESPLSHHTSTHAPTEIRRTVTTATVAVFDEQEELDENDDVDIEEEIETANNVTPQPKQLPSQPPSAESGLGSFNLPDYSKIFATCKGWPCQAQFGGWPIPLMMRMPESTDQIAASPLSSSIASVPAPLPQKPLAPKLTAKQYVRRGGSLTVVVPVKSPKTTVSTDGLLTKMRQFHFSEMTDFLNGTNNDELMITQANANTLLLLLNDVSQKPQYATDMLRSMGTDCSTFVDYATFAVNKYAAEFKSAVEREAAENLDGGLNEDTPIPPGNAYASWLLNIQNLGFEPSANQGFVWQSLPPTLMYCDDIAKLDE